MAQSPYDVSPQPQHGSDPGHPNDDGVRDPPLAQAEPKIPPPLVPPPERGDDDKQ
jgi:hypothetical protein